jgi:hypothetical protein
LAARRFGRSAALWVERRFEKGTASGFCCRTPGSCQPQCQVGDFRANFLMVSSSWYRVASVSSGAEARGFLGVHGTAEAVPFQSRPTPRANLLWSRRKGRKINQGFSRREGARDGNTFPQGSGPVLRWSYRTARFRPRPFKAEVSKSRFWQVERKFHGDYRSGQRGLRFD